jgi:hypothetical protein
MSDKIEPIYGLQDAIERLAGEWVYFIQCAGRIKIGYSKSLARRIVKMGTDLPEKPIWLHIEEGTRTTEIILHRQFADLRVKGEWFTADQRIYDHIQRRRIVLGKPDFIPPSAKEA